MTCPHCETAIEKGLTKIDGVTEAKASYKKGNALLEIDDEKVTAEQIKSAVAELGYSVVDGTDAKKNDKIYDKILTTAINTVGVLVILCAAYFLFAWVGLFDLFSKFSVGIADTNDTGLLMLFVIGLLTSVHCVAMCGGINISQNICTKNKSIKNGFLPALLYNLGRLISYTVIGIIVGAIGMALTFTDTARGIVSIVVAVLMIIMGLNLIGVLPFLRYIMPRMPKAFAKKIDKIKAKKLSPLFVGLLNGFMPCGPLQTMQIYALSTGSWFLGGLSMFLFALGTIPLMFILGLTSSLLTKKFADTAIKISSILVVIMGLFMLYCGIGVIGG
jgi:sulfite exporter TauE/SafE/copper chaperone CopZ